VAIYDTTQATLLQKKRLNSCFETASIFDAISLQAGVLTRLCCCGGVRALTQKILYPPQYLQSPNALFSFVIHETYGEFK
jgi:hypothetical protein